MTAERDTAPRPVDLPPPPAGAQPFELPPPPEDAISYDLAPPE